MAQPGRINPFRSISFNRLKDAFNIEVFSLMSLLRKVSIPVVGAISIAVLTSGTLCYAAKPMKVPANILKGSTVTKSRNFYSGTLPEGTLAGIRLGRPAMQVLAKWGNPSRITIGTAQADVVSQGAPATQSGPVYTPPPSTSANPYDSLSKSIAAAAGAFSLPSLPAAPQQPQPPADQTGGGTTSVLTVDEVTWTYDLPNGITLEFIITDGLVTQITVGGQGPWSLSKTNMGIQLGDTYKLVLWVSGYPESQTFVGRFLRLSYVNKNHALFTFLNKKLVGITISMVPQSLQ